MEGLSGLVLGILIVSMFALSGLAALGKMKARSFSGWLLALTLVTAVFYLLHYVPQHVKTGEPVVAVANYFLTYAPIQSLNQAAYVVPDSVKLWDTPARIRSQIGTLQSGDQVQALGRFRAWARVRTLSGQDGWMDANGLMNAATHDAEDHLRRELAEMPEQAAGHATSVDSVHIEPSRQSPIVTEVNPQQSLEIFGRRMVRRLDQKGPSYILPASPGGPIEAWYLVRAGSHAGWILGHRVQLDLPKDIAGYSQDANLVAWMVLDTVDDNGHRVPQYLVADRVGTPDCDFTGLRVLTWWKKKQTYAIAYKEEGLQGYFPILVTPQGSIPYFRVRLVDDGGAKAQKVYALFETMTHLVGTADSWESDATPEPRPARPRTRRSSLRASRRG